MIMTDSWGTVHVPVPHVRCMRSWYVRDGVLVLGLERGGRLVSRPPLLVQVLEPTHRPDNTQCHVGFIHVGTSLW